MRGPLLALSFAALSLGWLIFFGAGSRSADWNATVVFLGASALFYWTFRTGQTPPRLPLWHLLALWALPAYALFQVIPLPGALLEWLSPARALITQSLNVVIPNVGATPLSISPGAAWSGLFGLLTLLTTYSLLRDIGWRFVESEPWAPVAPIILLAGLQALIGLAQAMAGNRAVRGSFALTEPFAALLEMALPFTLVFAFISFQRHLALQHPSSRPALLAAGSIAASLLFLVDLYRNGSPSSVFVVLSSLFTLAALVVIPRLKTRELRRYGAGAAATVALVALFIVLPPTSLPDAAARLSTDSPEERIAVWTNSATLFNDFRWFGAGLGGFEAVYPRYQASANLKQVTDPGNDVLAVLISFGVIGFVITLAAIGGVMRPAIVGAVHFTDEPRRLLAASLFASLLAALLRAALGDGLTYPAIALVFAWLAGLAQSSGLD